MMKYLLVSTLFAGLSLAACSAPATSTQGDSAGDAGSRTASPDHAERLAEARRELAAGNYDEALLITDELLKADPRDREALVLAGQGNRALFATGRSGRQALLIDAIDSYERALEIDGDDPRSWLQLAGLELERGEFEAGRDAALEAARRLRDAKAEPAEIGAALIAAADNEMRIFVAARRPETEAGDEPSAATIELAQTVLSRLAAAQAGAPGLAHEKAATVYQWLGRTSDALRELERGITAAPAHAPLHDAFMRLHAGMEKTAECAAAYRRMAEDRPDGMMLWNAGRAEAMHADGLRAKSQFPEAAAAYARAAETFGRYAAMHPEHAANTNHWMAILELSRARCALESGDLQTARQHYTAAYEAAPDVAEYGEDGMPKIYDSFGGNYLAGLDLIGRAIAERSSADALAESLRHYEWVIERHPDKFGAIYNNAALSARDYGVAIERRARRDTVPADERAALEARARELWEKSYEYYCKAVELAPDDPRIVNDCGLMLIYHLHRDYDRAKELFERAIEIGQPMVDALPEDADETRRQDLEEAVGDAWQNLAVMMRQTGKTFADYEPHCRKATEYYPYKRRTAWLLLQSKGERAIGLPAAPQPAAGTRKDGGSGAAIEQGASRDDERAKVFAEVEKRAEAKAAEQDYDSALLLLDEHAKELNGYAPFHFLNGRYCLSYARQAAARGGTAGQVDGLFADALMHLKKAVEIDSDPIEPRLRLAEAYEATGDPEAAAREADSLLSHIRSEGGAKPEWLQATHRIRANANVRAYVTSKQGDGAGDEAALRRLRQSFAELEKSDALSEKDVQSWTTAELWAGAQKKAFEIFARAWKRDPSSQYLLDRVVASAADAGDSELAVEALDGSTDATRLWYLGKARYNLAQEQWAAGKADQAVKTLDAAVADFDASQRANPQYAESCKQWTALALGSKGLVLMSSDDNDAAQEALIAAAKTGPDRIEADLGGGNSVKRGILVLADKFFRSGDLGRTEQVYRAARDAAPADSDFANNHGLMARDHGSAIERRDPERAKELFEASYESYTRAAELEPDSVRLLNDRALLLIYHLRRDLDAAREILDQAIAKGTAQLEDAPPSDPDELRNLQEAVGDCFQNLGYYHEHHGDDLEAARKCYEKSLTYYPFRARASSRHLQRVLDKIADKQAGKDGDKDADKDGRP